MGKKTRPHEATHRVIICAECGAPRTVRLQDVFQVTLCTDCQYNRRLARRKELHEQEKANTADMQ